MSEYWLMQNLMYNHKYIVKANKLRRLIRHFCFGYSLRVGITDAYCEPEAKEKFKADGHDFGLFN